MDGHVWRPVPLSHMMGKRRLKMNSFFPKHSRFPISTRMMLHCSGGRTVQPLPHHFLLFVPTTIYCIEASLMSQQKEQPAFRKTTARTSKTPSHRARIRERSGQRGQAYVITI